MAQNRIMLALIVKDFQAERLSGAFVTVSTPVGALPAGGCNVVVSADAYDTCHTSLVLKSVKGI